MAQSARQDAIPAAVLESLRGLLGAEHVLSDQVDRELFSHDFSDIALATAGVVVQPGSTDEVARVARIASAATWRLFLAAEACLTPSATPLSTLLLCLSIRAA